MKKEYRQIYDEINPGEKLLESVFEMREKKKTTRFSKRIVSAVLALVILAGGMGFGVHYSNSKKISNNPVGTVMIAGAEEPIGSTASLISYQIYVKDIDGLNDDELYNAKVDMLKEMGYPIHLKPTLMNGLKNDLKINGRALYATEQWHAMNCLILDNIENPDDVEKISISNKSEYGNVVIFCNDMYYVQNDETTADEAQFCLEGHNISVEGSRYSDCCRLDSKRSEKYGFNINNKFNGTVDKVSHNFYIEYHLTDKFFDALGKNPDMYFTTYDEEMTVNVDFKNGYTATNVIKIGFEEDGKMFMQCKSYNYSETK